MYLSIFQQNIHRHCRLCGEKAHSKYSRIPNLVFRCNQKLSIQRAIDIKKLFVGVDETENCHNCFAKNYEPRKKSVPLELAKGNFLYDRKNRKFFFQPKTKLLRSRYGRYTSLDAIRVEVTLHNKNEPLGDLKIDLFCVYRNVKKLSFAQETLCWNEIPSSFNVTGKHPS